MITPEEVLISSYKIGTGRIVNDIVITMLPGEPLNY